MSGKAPHVEMRNIDKSFGDIQALRSVNFRVNEGEIVGLVGDNGAGKTTLIKVLAGVYKPDKGKIYYRGEKVNFNSPADARNLGIEPVHQRGAVIDEMSVWENLFLGRTISKKIGPLSKLDKDKMRRESEKILQSIGVNVSADSKMENLSGGERQTVAIGRAIHFGGELLILDEPTASLSLKETKKVLRFIENVRNEGCSVTLISHLTRHVYPAADRIVVLDNGRKIVDCKKDEISREQVELTIVKGRLKS